MTASSPCWHKQSVESLASLLLLLLLLANDVHRNPGPHRPRPSQPQVPTKILQFNTNGLNTSKNEIESFLHDENIKVACIQETKLRPASEVSFGNFAIWQKDRPTGGGGGVAFLIHHDLEFSPIDTSAITANDNIIEIIAAKIHFNHASLNVYSIYIPPASSCPPDYAPNFDEILHHSDGDAILLGDFNAHHAGWSSLDDARGASLVDAVDSSSFYIANEDHHTRLPTSGNPSSPDVSIASAHLVNDLSWSVPTVENGSFSARPLNSDHLPIVITVADPLLQQATPSIRQTKTYVNFHRANWANFTRDLDAALPATPPTSCTAGEVLRRAIHAASRRNIPAGFRHDFVPNFPPAAAAARDRRDALRAADPSDPRIAEAGREIRVACNQAARERFNEELSSADGCSSKLANLIRRVSGKRIYRPPNQPVSFNDRVMTKRRSIANGFNKQYCQVIQHKSNRATRKVIRKIKKKKLVADFTPLSEMDVAEAIKQAKSSSAAGPDDVTMLHLKHFGGKAIKFLTHIFNLSVQKAEMPAIWKQAVILPVPKPGKPAEISTSYRPISLLAPASKILERCLLPYFKDSLKFAPSQHGFRSGHSTTTALLPLVQRIASGFNQRKPPLRTATVAIDISKAFERVDHTLLLDAIASTDLHPNLVRWTAAYLRGWQSRVIWQGATSKWRIVRTGVPQGSVLGPIFFNFFVSDCPTDQPSFADDFTFSRSAVHVEEIEEGLQQDLDKVCEWAARKKLVIAPSKCTVTFFTPDKARESGVHPQVKIGDQVIPLEKNPKILGVTFDTHLHFYAHARRKAKEGRQKLRVLRSLAGSSWGCSKETLSRTYKTHVESALFYAPAVWSQNASSSAVNELQKVVNAAARITTGCHSSTPTEDLIMEAQVLPAESRLDMLSQQALVSALRQSHPSHAVVTAPEDPRRMKETLATRHRSHVSSLLTNGVVPPSEYKGALKTIHSNAVSSAIDRHENSRILGGPRPQINPSESTLSRAERSTLAQLRSGECQSLNNYLAKVGRATSAICPECRFQRHTVHHLFTCDARPTDLSVRDLWTDPVASISFLKTLPAFSHLASTEPPAPRPPPEPPPGDSRIV